MRTARKRVSAATDDLGLAVAGARYQGTGTGPDDRSGAKPSLFHARRPLWIKRVGWVLTGKSGRTIGWRIKLEKARYSVGVSLAERVCRGNRYGSHTPAFPAKQQLGGPCLCSRVRRRLDYIPF